MKWRRHLQRTYQTSMFSEANIFCIIIYYLALSIPFYLSFGFWMKENVDIYSTSFTFTGDYIAQISYYDSSSSQYKSEQISNVPQINLVPTIISISFNGITQSQKNVFKFEISSTQPSNIIITSIDLNLFYRTEIQGLKRIFISTSKIFVDFSSGKSIKLIGIINLNQMKPLTLFSNTLSLLQPPYVKNEIYLTNYQQIISNIESSSVLSTIYDSIYSNSNDVSYNLQISLFNQKMNQIKYYPSFTQTLRNAFSQYFSLLIVTLFLARSFLGYLADHKVFPLQINEKQFKLSQIQQR